MRYLPEEGAQASAAALREIVSAHANVMIFHIPYHGDCVAGDLGDEFREFAKRYATSPEIGPIQTSLDRAVDAPSDCDRIVFGLWGCDSLCAVACFHFYQSARNAFCAVRRPRTSGRRSRTK